MKKNMKNFRVLRGLLSFALTFAMLAGMFVIPSFASEAVPEMLVEGSNSLTRFTVSVMTEGSVVSFATEDKAPVTDAYKAVCPDTAAPTSIGQGGIRGNSGFQVPVAGSVVAVSYWMKAEGVEAPQAYGMLSYIKSSGGSGSAVYEGTATKISQITQTLEADVWYKCIQIFNVPYATTNSTDKTNVDPYASLRFSMGCSQQGQNTYIGGFSVYNFGKDYAYDGKTNEEAVSAYIQNANLTAIYNNGQAISDFSPEKTAYETIDFGEITATAGAFTGVESDHSQAGKCIITAKSYKLGFNKESEAVLASQTYTVQQKDPGTNALSSTYDLGCWNMANAAYFGAARPTIVSAEGQSFEKAIRFWGNDAAYGADDMGKSMYRGQLSSDYFIDSANWQIGDKIYISFWAKSFSKYGEECKVSFVLQGETAAGAGLASAADTVSFNLTDTWQQYSSVISIKEIPTDAVGIRATMHFGYYGQITEIADFAAYRCDATLSDGFLKKYYDGKSIINLLTDENCDSKMTANGGSTDYRNQKEIVDESDITLPFTQSQKFSSISANYNVTSTVGTYSARLTAVDQEGYKENDLALYTFWARADVEETYLTTAQISPKLAWYEGGSTKSVINPINDAGVAGSVVTDITGNWKKYGYIFRITDTGTYSLRTQVDLGLKGQTTYLANVQLYNLGSASVSDAFALLHNADLSDAYFETRAMEKNGNTYTAWAFNNDTSFDRTDFGAAAKQPFACARVESTPSSVGGNGVVTVTAADGTVQSYPYTLAQLPAVTQSDFTYKAGNWMTMIIKCDDLNATSQTSMDQFQALADLGAQYGVKLSFGVIGNTWESATEQQWEILRGWQRQGIEIWSHGYTHEPTSYSTDTYAQQQEDFGKVIDLMKAHGINITTFGSPENNSTVITAKMINECYPQIETLLLTLPNTVSNQLVLSNRVYLETDTGVASFDNFKSTFAARNYQDYAVVQLHPSMYDDADMEMVKSMFEYLQDNNIGTMTPHSYKASLTQAGIDALQGGAITTSVTINGGTQASCPLNVIYALYSADQNLVDCVVKRVATDAFEETKADLTVNVPQDGAYYTKAFIWDGADGITPICASDRLDQ